ncbi:MAG: hypothetical protein Q9M89_03060 [Persephonella sp.]|nr:hypothetical protein [Persephonella sp.]
MFSESVKENLRKELKKLIEPVVLVFHGREDRESEETKNLLQEIISLSEKIEFVESEGLSCEGYPCISIQIKEKDFGIRFMGKPDGGEFPAFVQSILMCLKE